MRSALDARHPGALEDAVAEAWRAVADDPDSAARLAILASVLARAGAQDLAAEALCRACAHPSVPAPLALALLGRLAEIEPAAAVSLLPPILTSIEPEAPGVGEEMAVLLRRVGLSAVGMARRVGNEVRVWTLRTTAPDDDLMLVIEGQEGTLGAVPAEPCRIRGRMRHYRQRWPNGADAVMPILTRRDALLAGGPLCRPSRVPTRVPARPSDAGRLPVSVVVPVHSDTSRTLDCLASVQQAGCRTPFRVVVVDDAIPDPRLRHALARMAEEGLIERVVHRLNRGFTASANAGLRASAEGDAVLLNADTRVPPGWLDRLRAAALGAADIGTVTPLTNNGQHVSFPESLRAAPAPSKADLADLDRCAQRVNAGGAVEIPVGAGFCLYIRRPCLADTGLLDEAAFGRGYGEETDFCLRAAARGWRHVCATDVFVSHAGGTSFRAEKASLVARNMPRLAARHPDYRSGMAKFLAADPLGPARQRLQRACLPGPEQGRTLHLVPPRPRPHAGLSLSIEPGAARPVVLRDEGGGDPVRLAYGVGEAVRDLPGDIARLGIAAVAVRTLALPPAVLDLLTGPARVFDLHLSEARMLAALEGEAGPDACRVADLLSRARRVHAFSRFAARRVADLAEDRLCLSLPGAPPSCLPDGDMPGRRLSLALLADRPAETDWCRVNRLLAARADPALRVFLIGPTDVPHSLCDDDRIRALGPVAQGKRRALLRALGCRTGLIAEPAPDPDGKAVDRMAALCPRLLVLGAGAAIERAALHRQALCLPEGCNPQRMAEALEMVTGAFRNSRNTG